MTKATTWLWGEPAEATLRHCEQALAVATALRLLPLLGSIQEMLTSQGYHVSTAHRSLAVPAAWPLLSPLVVPLVVFALVGSLHSVGTKQNQSWARALLALFLLAVTHWMPHLVGAADALLMVAWTVLALEANGVDAKRVLQLSLVLYYISAGLGHVRSGWVSEGSALWATSQGPAMTWVSAWMLRSLPLGLWAVLQALLLAWELGSPLWLGIPKWRVWALRGMAGYHGLGMLLHGDAWQLALCAGAFAVLFGGMRAIGRMRPLA